MKIALVSEHASPLAVLGGDDAGGQNVHVAELARGLGRLGAEVVVHTRRDDPALDRRVPFAPNVVVDHVTAGPPEPLPKDELWPHMGAFAEDLATTWTFDRPDAVHSHFWMSGYAALEAARTVDVPVLHTFHALGSEKRRQQGAADSSPLQRLEVERCIARQADALVATTSAEAAELVSMGADPDRVVVIPCGVDLERFRPRTGPSAAVSGVDGRRRPRIVAASRLVPRKGIADLVRALRLVPEAELVIAGGSPGALVLDDVEGARLHQLAEDLGIAERVKLIGAIPREAMPDLLRSADVVACCPWYEPFGMVAVEAMACGVPVLATAVGGLAETVVPGETGTLVTPRDPQAIAIGLRDLLAHDDGRRRMGRAAARRARGYGWDDIARRTMDVAADQSARRQTPEVMS